MVDFGYFLQQKYAQLQQQADARTSDAASAAITANAQANNLNADAALTGVRTSVLPAESAAQVGLQRAQTALTGNQASVVIPTADAQIAQTKAATAGQVGQNTYFNRVNNTLLPGIGVLPPTPGALGSVFGASPVPRLSTPETPQRPGESYPAYLDRINGL